MSLIRKWSLYWSELFSEQFPKCLIWFSRFLFLILFASVFETVHLLFGTCKVHHCSFFLLFWNVKYLADLQQLHQDNLLEQCLQLHSRFDQLLQWICQRFWLQSDFHEGFWKYIFHNKLKAFNNLHKL